MAFEEKLKRREKKKVKEIIKMQERGALYDVERSINSGMIDTEELKRMDDYVFAKAIVKEGTNKMAFPNTKEAKSIQRDVRESI